jgi:hypothetical protein
MKTHLCPESQNEQVSHQSGDDWPLSAEDIAERSTSAPALVERLRWRMFGLLLAQPPIAEVATATGYGPRVIRQIAQRYRELEPPGLTDGRRHRAGAVSLLRRRSSHQTAFEQF